MLDLNEIMSAYRYADTDEEFIARARIWLPTLVEELREARAKADTWYPAWQAEEIRRARAEIERLRTKGDAQAAELRNIRPKVERLRALVPSDDEYSYAELPQAWRVERDTGQ